MDTAEKEIMTKQSDHDLLITLVETVKNNQTATIKEIGDVKEKVKEVKDGLSTQVADHELRIKSIEKLRDEVNPMEMVKKLNEVYLWKQNFQFTWRFIVAAAALIGGLTGFIISLLTGVIGFFGPK